MTLLPALLALLAANPELAPTDPAAPAAPAPPSLPAPTVRPPRPPLPRAAPAPAAQRAPAMLAALESRRQGEWPEQRSGLRVTLKDKLTIDGALEKIAAAGGWSLIANTGRTGDRLLVVTLRDVPVEDALEAVLEGTALVATRRGNSVTVAPGPVAPVAEVPTLTGFDVATGKKFTGDFREIPVSEALAQVAAAGNLSIVLPPGARGLVTARFKDAPVEDALRVLLSQAGFVAAREGSIVTVSRSGGARLVIRGSKRTLVMDGDGAALPGMPPLPDVGNEVAQALKEAGKDLERQARAEAEADLVLQGHHRGRKDKVISGDTVIGPGERAQEVVVLQGNVRLEPGATAEQVTAILGSVELGPGVDVEREVVAIFGDVHVSQGAHVGGDAVSIGGRVIIDEGGEVDGQQTSIGVPGIGSMLAGLGPVKAALRPSPALRVLTVLAEFAVFFVLGLLFLALVPRRLDSVANALGHAPVKTVLVGLLGTVAMPVLTVLLVVTVVGIPLVAVQVIAAVGAGILGFTALALHLGRAAARKLSRGGEVLRLALGTALVVAVMQVPILGVLAALTAWLFVFGAVLRTRFGQPQPGVLDTTAIPAPPQPPPAQAA